MTLEQKIWALVRAERKEILAHSYLRYEALSKLGPGEFNGIHHEAMRTGKTFDALVDELIEKDAK